MDEALVEAGAVGVWDDTAALLADLDAALCLAAQKARVMPPLSAKL
jgi:hypothetical protein